MTLVAVGIGAGAIVAGAAGKAIYSGVQAGKARKAQAEAERKLNELEANSPIYTPPKQYQENIGLAKGVMKGYEPYTKTSQLAGQALIENQLAGNTAGAINTLERAGLSQGQVAAGIGSALAAQNLGTTELGIQGAKQRQQYQQLYGNAAQDVQKANIDMANQEETAWTQNVLNKFNRQYQRQGAQFAYQQQQRQKYKDQTAESGFGGLQQAGGLLMSAGASGAFSGTRAGKGAGIPTQGMYMNPKGEVQYTDTNAFMSKQFRSPNSSSTPPPITQSELKDLSTKMATGKYTNEDYNKYQDALNWLGTTNADEFNRQQESLRQSMNQGKYGFAGRVYKPRNENGTLWQNYVPDFTNDLQYHDLSKYYK